MWRSNGNGKFVVSILWLLAGCTSQGADSPAGSDTADYQNAVRQLTGDGVPIDRVKAAQLFRTAAKNGHMLAKTFVAMQYFDGRGVKKDVSEAAKIFQETMPELRKLAESGQSMAQYRYGLMFYHGLGVEENDQEAIRWFRSAAEQNLAMSQEKLGRMYMNGQGVDRDDFEAAVWYRKAADQNYADGQNSLGFAYARGRGVPHSDISAFRWYMRAAEQGHRIAESNVANFYYYGRLGHRDFIKAREWYQKSADHGYSGAQEMLGQMHFRGEGVSKDSTQSRTLFGDAAGKGHQKAMETLEAFDGPFEDLSTQLLLQIEPAQIDVHRRTGLLDALTSRRRSIAAKLAGLDLRYENQLLLVAPYDLDKSPYSNEMQNGLQAMFDEIQDCKVEVQQLDLAIRQVQRLTLVKPGEDGKTPFKVEADPARAEAMFGLYSIQHVRSLVEDWKVDLLAGRIKKYDQHLRLHLRAMESNAYLSATGQASANYVNDRCARAYLIAEHLRVETAQMMEAVKTRPAENPQFRFEYEDELNTVTQELDDEISEIGNRQSQNSGRRLELLRAVKAELSEAIEAANEFRSNLQ